MTVGNGEEESGHKEREDGILIIGGSSGSQVDGFFSRHAGFSAYVGLHLRYVSARGRKSDTTFHLRSLEQQASQSCPLTK